MKEERQGGGEIAARDGVGRMRVQLLKRKRKRAEMYFC